MPTNVQRPQKRRIPGRKKQKMRPGSRSRLGGALPLTGQAKRARLYTWMIHPLKRLKRYLEIDAKFVESLTPNTRILEVGAGTGRLANFLLSRTRLKPENYEIMDLAYQHSFPAMQKRIFLLIKQGKLKATAGNMFTHKYPRKAYDHILFPESYFREKLDQSTRLPEFIRRLAPALRENGTIRISNIGPLDERHEGLWELRDEFDITKLHYDEISGDYGIILKKKKK